MNRKKSNSIKRKRFKERRQSKRRLPNHLQDMNYGRVIQRLREIYNE